MLRQQLIDQSTIDPEEYFGAIPELKMEEILKQTRVSKFQVRTSSGLLEWHGQVDSVGEGRVRKEYGVSQVCHPPVLPCHHHHAILPPELPMSLSLCISAVFYLSGNIYGNLIQIDDCVRDPVPSV